MPSGERIVKPDGNLRHKGRINIKTMGRDGVMLNHDTIDLRYVEQLADSEQLTSLGHILRCMEEEIFDGHKTVGQAVEAVWKKLCMQGLSAVCEGSSVPGNLAMPRKQEIYACVNRYRKLGTVTKK